MILFRIFFLIIGFFFLLMMGLGVMVWLRLRVMGLHSIFSSTQKPPAETPFSESGNNVIEGEYTVITESKDTK